MPVDIAFGTVKLEYEDISLPGKVALVWDRRYSTALLEKSATPLGLGWTCRYYATLTYRDGRFEFVTPEGGTEIFPNPSGAFAKGEVIRNYGAFLELFRQDRRCIVQSWNVETGEVWRYCFDLGSLAEPWKLASIEDVSGQGVDLLWDATGRLASVRQRLERRELRFAYDKRGQIEKVFLQAPNGERHHVMEYGYDANGRQIEVRDAARFADRFEYDEQGRLTREIVKDGGIFHYRYDDQGRCVLRTGLNHYNEKRLRYIDGIRVTEVTNSYGAKFTYQHLPSGQAVLEVDPLGGKRTTDYDEHGRIVAKTDATGSVTRYTYDRYGNRASVVNALGNTYIFAYNDHHLPVSMTDPLGQVWRLSYDTANRHVATIDPLGNRWLIVYDAEGNAGEMINPLGARKYKEYTQGILTAVTDWLGNITRFRLDAFGRVIERTGVLGDVTRFSYDALGNANEIILPNGATLHATYDSVGNLTRFVDANGHITRFRYGSCQRLLERVDPAGGVVQYVWGSEPGRLEQIINEKAETYTFFRDDAGRIIRERSFDGAERLFEYDAEGYATAYINANAERIHIEWDPLHRVIGQTLPDGGQASFGYDRTGNLTTAINADVTVRFERDALGRVVRELQGENWVGSRYDAAGHLIHTTTSLGHTVDYQVDANGSLSKLTTFGDHVLEFVRNGYGRETSRKMPGGLVMEQRYNDLGCLIEQRVGLARLLSNAGTPIIAPQPEIIGRVYTYDRNGSLTSIVDDRRARVDYVYDPAERLLEAIRKQGPSEAFSYDPTGNVTRIQIRDRELIDETLIYRSGNQLLQMGSTLYEYDAEGRRIKKIEGFDDDDPRVWQYEWDALDRLRAVTRPNGEVWKYKYDALARRVEKTGPNERRQFLWDREVVLHELEEAHALSTWIFSTDSFEPLATIQQSGFYTIINDHLGTPKELIDKSGSVALSIDALAWGKGLEQTRSSVTSLQCPLRFQGQWWDGEIGLSYTRYRYYDPEVGSFVSKDPIGLRGGNNLYSYAPNPIAWIDPWGLVNAPASLPDTPGVYVVTNGNQSYVGSAGQGQQGMYTRLSSSSDPAQAILGQPGTKVQFIQVDLGTATTRSDRNNILRYYEQRELDKQVAAGYDMLNVPRAQAVDKKQGAEDLIEEHGVHASARRTTCKPS